MALIFTDVNYASAVEKGTKPHFPPPQSLSGWASRHGMTGLEFVIARSIASKGTKAQPFMLPAYEDEQSNFINNIERVLESLERV